MTVTSVTRTTTATPRTARRLPPTVLLSFAVVAVVVAWSVAPFDSRSARLVCSNHDHAAARPQAPCGSSACRLLRVSLTGDLGTSTAFTRRHACLRTNH
jgi:hypothetical protein